ncbi:hypothetical protein DV738_g1398, partial [Chaetothyriales sp. CBS 135597]
MLGLEDSGSEQCAAGMSRLETEGSSSPLERLPGELICRVLTSVSDLATLRSLIHASPVLHSAYLHNRNTVLRVCLGRELDGVLVDACATLMSRVRMLGSPRTNKLVIDFLNVYKGWLSGSSPYPDLESINPSSIRWMASVHLAVVRPLALRYADWALANLRKGIADTAVAVEGTPTEPHTAEDSMSRSEEIRVLRALYRYETYYHLFGRNDGVRYGGFRHHEISEYFFGLFEPWEAEACGSIDLFVRAKYEDIFNEVKPDLHPRNSRFLQENGVYNPQGSFDLDNEHNDYMNGTVSRGLKIIARLLAIHDHETLVAKVERHLTHDQWMDASLETVLDTVAQNDRREMLGTNSRDEAEQRMDPLTFFGDAVPPVGPPFAWVVLWNGKYANVYGGYVPEALRRWGYVIWDEGRWRQMGAEGLIAKQWELAPDLVKEIETDCDWNPISRGLET